VRSKRVLAELLGLALDRGNKPLVIAKKHHVPCLRKCVSQRLDLPIPLSPDER
jgi:hypothetical protein